MTTGSNEELRGALERCQWGGCDGLVAVCPVCFGDQTQGHAEDCIVGRALEAALPKSSAAPELPECEAVYGLYVCNLREGHARGWHVAMGLDDDALFCWPIEAAPRGGLLSGQSIPLGAQESAAKSSPDALREAIQLMRDGLPGYAHDERPSEIICADIVEAALAAPSSPLELQLEEAVRLATHLLAVPPPQWQYAEIHAQAKRVLAPQGGPVSPEEKQP